MQHEYKHVSPRDAMQGDVNQQLSVLLKEKNEFRLLQYSADYLAMANS
jgi:hypothetical protein